MGKVWVVSCSISSLLIFLFSSSETLKTLLELSSMSLNFSFHMLNLFICLPGHSFSFTILLLTFSSTKSTRPGTRVKQAWSHRVLQVQGFHLSVFASLNYASWLPPWSQHWSWPRWLDSSLPYQPQFLFQWIYFPLLRFLDKFLNTLLFFINNPSFSLSIWLIWWLQVIWTYFHIAPLFLVPHHKICRQIYRFLIPYV